MRHKALLLIAIFTLATSPQLASGQSLRGSSDSMSRQSKMAARHNYTHLRTSADVQKFVRLGLLVEIPRADTYYELAGVSFPYARPEVKLFIDRLSRQYHSACKEKLIITSLTRPQNKQPHNASKRSVHPTGMALDLRVPTNPKCKQWLERTLMELEKIGVLDATKERNPPHYHVAIFSHYYRDYVRRLEQKRTSQYEKYTVKKGDSLWLIARRFNTSVSKLKEINNLKSNNIRYGQTILVPAQ